MIFICFFWFLLLYGGVYYIFKKEDLFSPIKFVCLKFAVFNLPFILYTAFNPITFPHSILKVCGSNLNDAFLKYSIIQTLAFVSLIAGILLLKKIKPVFPTPKPVHFDYKKLRILSFVLFGIGLSAYFIFLSRIGGLMYLLTHLDQRVALQSGQYVLTLLPLLSLSCLLMMQCVKLENKIQDKILLILFSLLTIAVFSSFGARKNALYFCLALLIGYHYIIGGLRFTRKTISIVAVLFVVFFAYIIVIPQIREHNDLNKKISDYKVNTKFYIYNTSYAFIDIFAANYFNKDNAWFMKGYFAPAIVPFTNTDKKNLPQVDQGVYFNSIVKYQKNFEPPLPRNQLSNASWPTENFGFAYANFLLPGIVVFFVLQGIVFALAYYYLIRQKYNPVIILIYTLVIIDFNFSSLRIVSFIKLLPLLLFAYIIVKKVTQNTRLFK